MTTSTPFYIRRPDESIDNFVDRILAEPPRGPLFIEPRPGKKRYGRTGRPNGRPRGDSVIAAALTTTSWTLTPVVVERTGKGYRAVLKALQRAHQRGLIDHKRGSGYRLRSSP